MDVTERPFEESDGSVRLAHCQVHVPERRLKILVPRELLNRECGRSLHRQVRAARVAQDVKPTRRLEHRSLLRLEHPLLEDLGGHRLASIRVKHTVALQVN